MQIDWITMKLKNMERWGCQDFSGKQLIISKENLEKQTLQKVVTPSKKFLLNEKMGGSRFFRKTVDNFQRKPRETNITKSGNAFQKFFIKK